MTSKEGPMADRDQDHPSPLSSPSAPSRKALGRSLDSASPGAAGGAGAAGADTAPSSPRTAPRSPAATAGSPRVRETKTAEQLLEARDREARERQLRLLASIGQQQVSHRPSVHPVVIISPKQRFRPDVREVAVPREIEPPSWPPGPGKFTDHKTSVLKDFGQESRFWTQTPPAIKGRVPICDSTAASPFSTTYPYVEPEEMHSVSATALPHSARNPETTVDKNLLAKTRSNGPSWSFSNVGRFGPVAPHQATKYSPRATRSRLRDFEVLRDQMVGRRPSIGI